ncbi:hypothetical protein [uncultured Pseudodesulfovibrio sp.]|uniref:hypothetical protein n=1 Tax=uncultured Pseudodesulfovibrio sp. TaxID=2035858 RepID=UPI0029C921AB|nr:hypothetical protein [uncultured Pseudodesulfovibrio sp.]
MVGETRGLRSWMAWGLAMCLLLTPALAWAYGGGGGDVGGSTSKTIEPWTPTKLSSIFKNVSPSEKNTLVKAFTGSTISKRELLTIRQVFLEKDSAAANNEAAMLDACVKTLEVLDKMGELSQTGLSFVPGVGWVTSATLSAARGGANAYRNGLSRSDIAKGVVIGATSSALMSKFSPMNADKAFNTAKAGISLARNTVNSQVRTKAMAIAAKALARYGLKKTAEGEMEAQLGKRMEDLANYLGAPNVAQQPSYVPDPTYDPMSSAPATPVAGGTPQL